RVTIPVRKASALAQYLHEGMEPIKWSFIYNENLHQLIIMKKEIAIIGGGFAGINMARKLKNEKGIQVTLVDKNKYNFFTPLLYQVCTGMLGVSSTSTPFWMFVSDSYRHA